MDNVEAMNKSLDAIIGERRRRGGKLYSARAALIKDILDGMTSKQLAVKYEVTAQMVNYWKRENKAEIDAAMGDFVSVAAHARFARREERIWMLSNLIEETLESLEKRREKDYVKPGDDKETDFLREIRGLSHDIQEEMGQLLPRATDQATSVTIHNYHGISPEELSEMHKPFKLEKDKKTKAIEARADEVKANESDNVIDAEVVTGETNGEDEVST